MLRCIRNYTGRCYSQNADDFVACLRGACGFRSVSEYNRDKHSQFHGLRLRLFYCSQKKEWSREKKEYREQYYVTRDYLQLLQVCLYRISVYKLKKCVFQGICTLIYSALFQLKPLEFSCLINNYNEFKKKWPWKKCPGGGGQNLERPNLERPIFRNFKIANIKIMKDELFESFFFFNLFSHFLEIFWTPKIFNNLWNCKILIFQMAIFF